MTGWLDWRLGRVVELDTVARQGKVLSTTGGEARTVYEAADMPGWLVKLYRPKVAITDARLDRLTALPELVDEPARRLVHTATSWPVARVVTQGRSVGVVIPKAPDGFRHPFRRPDGSWTQPKTVDIDQLCRPDGELAQLGLRVPSASDRRVACRRLAEVGTLFERVDLVYADWSYTNTLWNPQDGAVYVIDMDSCHFGTRPWISSVNWEDPKLERGQPITTTTDRYRLGLLVARCLTGVRVPADIPEALLRIRDREPAVEVLLRMIYSGAPMERRPTIRQLARALGVADESRPNIAGWYSVGGPDATGSAAPTAAPAAPTAAASGRRGAPDAAARSQQPAAAPRVPPSTPWTAPPQRPGSAPTWPPARPRRGRPATRSRPPTRSRPRQPVARTRAPRRRSRPAAIAGSVVVYGVCLGALVLMLLGLARAF